MLNHLHLRTMQSIIFLSRREQSKVIIDYLFRPQRNLCEDFKVVEWTGES